MVLKDKSFLYLLIFPIILLACSMEETNVKPAYTGQSGELLIVSSGSLWNSNVGDSILEWFQPNFPMLPQGEAMFNLIHYQKDKLSQLTERHRNIIEIDIEPKFENKLVLQFEKNSKDQLYYVLRANSTQAAFEELQKSYPSIIQNIRDKERERYQQWLSLHHNEEIESSIKDSLGFSLNVPFGSVLLSLDGNYARIKWQREKILSGVKHFMEFGIVLYTVDYLSVDQFSLPGLKQIRNEELKRIPGPKPGSHMALQNVIEPELTVVKPLNGFAFGNEMRGLWRTTESFIGGPFISLAMLHENSNKIVIAEVFVLAPKFDKREFMKEAEAIVYSLNVAS